MRLLLLVLFLLPSLAAAQGVRVGVADAPPFAIHDENLGWSGIAVDLWRQIAEEEGVDYRIVKLEVPPADAVREGTVDIAFPADAAASTEGLAFSQPFYTATLAMVTQRRLELLAVARNIVSWQFVRIVLLITAIMLAAGALMWLIERKANSDMFPEAARPGLGSGFWWAGVTMTTLGYGDKVPVTAGGRAIALIWMLVALLVTSALTATLVSAVGIGGGKEGLPTDLTDRKIAVSKDSAALRYLQSRGLEPIVAETPGDALDLLGGEADAVFGDEPLLRYLIDERSSLDASVTSSTIDPHYITFATRDPRLAEALDRGILKRLPTHEWWQLTQKYLPGDD